jgi:Tol biopolymer transport system component
MKRTVIGAVLLTSSLLSACATGTPKPTTAGRPAAVGSPITGLTGVIVFARAGGQFGDDTIFTTSTRDSNELQVNDSGDGCCPRISPDGTQILASTTTSDGRTATAIYPTAGGSAEALPLPDGSINLGPGSWSPDGKKLTFEGWDADTPTRDGVYLQTGDGAARQLTKAPAGDRDVPMDFSPDGRQLLFLRVRASSDAPVGPLYVVGVNGTGLRRVTPGDVQPAYSARWSPDGREIVFATAYWKKPASPIMLVHPDGTGLHAVFTDPSGRAATTPTWSPDGKYIMFGLSPVTGDRHPINELDVVRANGTGLTQVVTTTDFKLLPDWVAR